MAELFTAITFEIYIGGSWVNISSDVMVNPPPRCSRGIRGNAPEDRVAGPGTLTFSLKNGHTNSAGLLGYYSPGHANCRSGWTTGLPVRLSFAYDGNRWYKWRGVIMPDGIKVIPGVKGPRRVDVSCYDYMGQVTYHKINLLTSQSNKTLAQAVNLIINNMPIAPLRTDLTNPSDSAFATVFDTSGADTTALSEFNKLAVSNRMFLVVRGDNSGGETLTDYYPSTFAVPKPAASSGALLLETGDQLLLETGGTDYLLLDETEILTIDNSDMIAADISYGKDLINYVTAVSYPRELGAAATTVLWKLQDATQLTAGQSITMRGAYVGSAGEKINGTDFVTPVSGTDFAAFANANGTGTNYTANMTVTATFGAAEVELTITNTHASASFYFGGASITFQVRGREVRTQEPVRVITKNTTSINTFGVRPQTVDLKYQNSYNSSATVGGNYLTVNDLGNPQYSIDKLTFVANKNAKNMYTFMYLEPGIYVSGPFSGGISDEMTGLSEVAPALMGYDFEILDGKTVRWSGVFSFFLGSI